MRPGAEHRLRAPTSVRVSLIVTGDSICRGEKADEVTPLVERVLSGTPHKLVRKRVVPNDAEAIRDEVLRAASDSDVVIVTGGTGLSPRDVSVDAVRPLASREVPGFGEIFRLKTYERHGPVAWLTRASAYVVGSSLVVVVPGSPDAVELALKEILLPEIAHAVGEIKRA